MVLSYTSQIRKSLLEKHKLVIALIAHLRGTTVTEKKKKNTARVMVGDVPGELTELSYTDSDK